MVNRLGMVSLVVKERGLLSSWALIVIIAHNVVGVVIVKRITRIAIPRITIGRT